MPEVHAKRFSPSASCKWLNCPGSVSLESEFPDKETDYTREGTLAHKIAELKVRKHFTVMSQKEYGGGMKACEADPLYDKEMQGYTDIYLDYIKEVAMGFSSAPFVAAEKQVSFEEYAPGGFGTSDCIIIGDNKMYVCDFKYGKGVPVDAHENTQGMLYALGALMAFRMFYDIKSVVISIIQPRLDNISEYHITAADLLNWADTELKSAVAAIQSGCRECIPGPWCDKGFCKARGVCKALAKDSLEIADFECTAPEKMTLADIGEALIEGKQLKKWLEAVEDYALKKALEGKKIPGWKVVAGRSVREFTDTDAAFKHIIEHGIEEEMLYKREPLTLTAVEKLMGKKEFADVTKDYVTKSKPKPALAEESDRRAEYKPNSAANDFAGIN